MAIPDLSPRVIRGAVSAAVATIWCYAAPVVGQQPSDSTEPKRTMAGKAYHGPDFDLVVPGDADVHYGNEGSPSRAVLSVTSTDNTAYHLTVTRLALPPGMRLEQFVRRVYLEDSTESAHNDWGTPGPVKRDSVAGLPAWSFEPTCGDCTMFHLFISRGHTILRFEYVYDEDSRLWSLQQAVYSLMLGSFRWHGA